MGQLLGTSAGHDSGFGDGSDGFLSIKKMRRTRFMLAKAIPFLYSKVNMS